jgi:hypothetical protein
MRPVDVESFSSAFEVTPSFFIGAGVAGGGNKSADTTLDERILKVVRHYNLRLDQRADFPAQLFIFDCHWASFCRDQQPQAQFVQIARSERLDSLFSSCSLKPWYWLFAREWPASSGGVDVEIYP